MQAICVNDPTEKQPNKPLFIAKWCVLFELITLRPPIIRHAYGETFKSLPKVRVGDFPHSSVSTTHHIPPYRSGHADPPPAGLMIQVPDSESNTHTHTQPNMHERQRTHTQPITCQQHLNELNSCLFSILCVESGHKAQLWQCTQRHLFSFLISTLYFKCILVLSVTLFTTTNIDRSWNGKNRSRSLARSYDNGFNPLIYCKKY